MSDNHIDTIVIPTLQRKCQELFNERTVLEINLQVEAAKRQACDEALVKARAELESLVSSNSKGDNFMQRALDSANVRIKELDERNQQLSKDLMMLKSELANAKRQVEDLKVQLTVAKSSIHVGSEEPKAKARPRKIPVAVAAEQESKDDF